MLHTIINRHYSDCESYFEVLQNKKSRITIEYFFRNKTRRYIAPQRIYDTQPKNIFAQKLNLVYNLIDNLVYLYFKINYLWEN